MDETALAEAWKEAASRSVAVTRRSFGTHPRSATSSFAPGFYESSFTASRLVGSSYLWAAGCTSLTCWRCLALSARSYDCNAHIVGPARTRLPTCPPTLCARCGLLTRRTVALLIAQALNSPLGYPVFTSYSPRSSHRAAFMDVNSNPLHDGSACLWSALFLPIEDRTYAHALLLLPHPTRASASI